VAASSDAATVVQTVLAPAKINLFLHVVGRRGDGYHMLESLVMFASIGDRLSVQPADVLSLSVRGRFASSINVAAKDNLVLRAATAFQSHIGSTHGARLILEKNLPVAAGIGGGSADAAAVILALNDLWQAGISVPEMEILSLPLGADIPACLHRQAVLMRGIGEELTPVPAPSGLGVVLVNPLKPLPTPAVFADFRSFEKFAAAGQIDWNAKRSTNQWIAQLNASSNSLEPPARRLLPVIRGIIGVLGEQEDCRLARMSGSGATCFGIFDNWQAAARCADRIASAHSDWWVAPGELLS
jgi:4-diphosphocytidyl-2-C-methyl-D-erythritol kinase